MNLFQILNRHFWGKGVKDEPIAVHGFGRGLLIDLAAVLARGEMPEAIKVSAPEQRFFIIGFSAGCQLCEIDHLGKKVFLACPLQAIIL